MVHQKYYFTQEISDVYETLSKLPISVLKQKLYLYKGIEPEFCQHEYVRIIPKSFYRPSKTQERFGNACNLLIDNLDIWTDYPKRSESIILSTSATTASRFGICYSVFPEKNSSLAICPDTDIWYSFRKSFYIMGLAGKNSSNFNNVIKDITHLINGEYYTGNDWHFLLDTLKNIPEYSGFQKGLCHESNIFLQKYHESGMKILDFLEHIFDPKTNGFNLVEWPSEFDIKNNNDNEVWTSCECLLIRSDKLEAIRNDILK